MNLHGVYVYVEQQLQQLPPTLTYHNAGHTLSDVLPASQRLTAAYRLTPEAQSLLETAALFHDIGYLRQYTDNEPIAADWARQVLPGFGYTNEQIGVVERLILVTALPQAPTCMLEAIMCDADLDSLWRDDFIVISQALRTELENHGMQVPQQDWLNRQIDFLQQHHYFCEAESSRRQAGKQQNIRILKQLLEAS